MDAVQPPKQPGLTHDTAARLLSLAPAELERLVGAGHVRRDDRNTYSPQILVGDYITYLRDAGARHPTQAEAAAHLDLSDRSVRELEEKLSLAADYTLDQIRIAYIRQLREVAAGRASTAADALDLAAERAALARSQRVGQELKNAVAQGEYAPIGLLGDVLAAASAAVVDRFDSLPGLLRKACPTLPTEARDAIAKVIASARNEWIKHTAELVMRELDQISVDDDEPADVDGDDPP